MRLGYHFIKVISGNLNTYRYGLSPRRVAIRTYPSTIVGGHYGGDFHPDRIRIWVGIDKDGKWPKYHCKTELWDRTSDGHRKRLHKTFVFSHIEDLVLGIFCHEYGHFLDEHDGVKRDELITDLFAAGELEEAHGFQSELELE